MYPNDQPQIIPPQKPRTLRRIVLIVGVALIALGVGLHVYRLLNAPTCFTASDYVEFYGSAPTDVTFEPGAEFFSGTYTFLPGTADLNAADSDASPSEDATNLAAFYKKHSGKLAAFTIEAAYPSSVEATSKSVAEKRAAGIKQLLNSAGIPAEMIQTKIEAYNLSDESSEYDAVDTVTLTLASTDVCRE